MFILSKYLTKSIPFPVKVSSRQMLKKVSQNLMNNGEREKNGQTPQCKPNNLLWWLLYSKYRWNIKPKFTNLIKTHGEITASWWYHCQETQLSNLMHAGKGGDGCSHFQINYRSWVVTKFVKMNYQSERQAFIFRHTKYLHLCATLQDLQRITPIFLANIFILLWSVCYSK